jgi:hypothetical protein
MVFAHSKMGKLGFMLETRLIYKIEELPLILIGLELSLSKASGVSEIY